MRLRKRIGIAVAAAIIVVLAGAALVLWNDFGAYGLNSFIRRGGSYWATMSADDPRLSPSMRLALKEPTPVAEAGPLEWQEADAGFEVAELPVLANGEEVDRIYLTGIDPTRYRFVARNRAEGDRDIDDWERTLPDAVLIVNGSYFDLRGRPDTPILSDGVALGPAQYNATSGAFVAGDGFAAVKDLTAGGGWQAAFAGAKDAMVSYPLLLGEDGEAHTGTDSRWLANRTFVGTDAEGRVIIGTTEDAFFSLTRLADFLKRSPLNLRAALNFDGGPIACQSVRINGFTRKLYARWEAQVSGSEVKLLTSPFNVETWAMPMVLTVERR